MIAFPTAKRAPANVLVAGHPCWPSKGRLKLIILPTIRSLNLARDGFTLPLSSRWYQRQQDALDKGQDIPMVWECSHCDCNHTGNLLRKMAVIKLEQVVFVGSVRIKPDLTAFASGGLQANFQEVVDTHSPEQQTHRLAETSGVPLLVFNVEQPKDIEDLLSKTLRPKVYYAPCVGLKCRKCAACLDCPKRKDHRFCVHCQRCVDRPISDHWYCEKCRECVKEAPDFGYSHRHCRDCEDLLNGRAEYPTCYCCFNARRFKLDPCLVLSSVMPEIGPCRGE